MGSHKSAPRRGEGGREPLRRRRRVGGKEGGRGRKEVRPGRCHCRGRGGARDPAEGLQQCSVGAGAAMSLIWGSGVCIPARVCCQSGPSPYHPGPKGGGGGQGTAELSLERDANRQSWEKVNKGHAPCRRPAGAHPPLRPPPVHFHSPSASPPPDSRAALGVGGPVPDPSPSPRRQGCAPSTLTCKGCPPTLQKKKTCLICAEPLSPGAEHAAPACGARVHPARRGGARRRRWPPEGVWDRTGCT